MADSRELFAVDIHTHLGPWKKSDIVKYQYEGPFHDYFGMAEEVGIGKTVVFKIKESENQLVKEYASQKKDRLFFAYWIDVENNHVIEELEASRKEIAALKFHPTFEKTKVTDEKLYPYWKWAENEGVPLLLHCGQWQEYSGYKLPLELAKKFAFPIVLFHMAGGGSSVTQGEAINFMLENPPPDNVFIETSSCFQPWLVERAVRAVGEDNVVFGSDFPSQDPRLALQCITSTRLDKDVKSKILGKNTLRILKR